MAFTDLPIDALRAHRSTQADPADFDDFWAGTLHEARLAGEGISPIVTLVETGLTTIDTFDVTFPGFGGQDVKAWLRVPHGHDGPLPGIVQYVGYGGGRGHALDNLVWASAGFAHLQMDTRGQGSGWSAGDTADDGPAGPQVPGMLTRGIRSKEDYYYRRLITDAVRAVDAMRTLPQVRADAVGVFGQSQGGGLALAVAGLVDDLAALVSWVPFLCDFPRATVITDATPYREVADYLRVHRDEIEQAHRTLSYFDGVNFAKRATAPAHFSAALMDEVCPPSTVFGAHNVYRGEASIDVWTYNGHEGGGSIDIERGIAFLREHTTPEPA